ncbi:hypothetical protein Q9K02_02275 [Qipengyuania sp. G39]|uniref:DUF2628 domain-containing protein n=1 Tax=Qipengyuania profundimaris TaxID=3067652 RepID=A0ABT9HLU3_9SPHN|nr:hypothetical protein [Qipengyuania sp. G39]MDP4573965.1 hypothetical protein [Qipengyuania sp. G39]
MTDRPTKPDDAWFLPKAFGYGAGWPIRWQGWALVIGYLVIVGACERVLDWDTIVGAGTAFAIIVPATLALILIAKAKTRGEWRWRWGSTD